MGETNKTYIDKESTQNVINALNVIAGNIEEEVHKEKQRPKYILRDNVINCENDIETFLSAGMERDKKKIKKGDIQTKIYIRDVVKEAEEWLKERGYEVHIVENLDCKDVNGDKRYYISITYMDKITTKIDFLDYQKRILDYEFDEVDHRLPVFGILDLLEFLQGLVGVGLRECTAPLHGIGLRRDLQRGLSA